MTDITALFGGARPKMSCGGVQALLEWDAFSSGHHPAPSSCFARDLFREPAPTFRDHAPAAVGRLAHRAGCRDVALAITRVEKPVRIRLSVVAFASCAPAAPLCLRAPRRRLECAATGAADCAEYGPCRRRGAAGCAFPA